MGKCTFLNNWLNKTDGCGYRVTDWCKKKNENEGYCIICESTFSVSKGFAAITQHVATNKHKTNISKISSTQLRLTVSKLVSDSQEQDSVNSYVTN